MEKIIEGLLKLFNKPLTFSQLLLLLVIIWLAFNWKDLLEKIGKYFPKSKQDLLLEKEQKEIELKLKENEKKKKQQEIELFVLIEQMIDQIKKQDDDRKYENRIILQKFDKWEQQLFEKVKKDKK